MAGGIVIGSIVRSSHWLQLNPRLMRANKDLERFGKYTINLAQVPDPVDYHTPVVSQVPLEEPDRPGKQTSSEQREGAV
jgi:hypothetical protein